MNCRGRVEPGIGVNMGRRIVISALALLLALTGGCSLLGSEEQSEYVEIDTGGVDYRRGMSSVPPQTKPDGRAFTLAYVDTDPYPVAGTLLLNVILGLRDEGWIFFDSLPFDPDDTDPGALIDWLAGQDLGPYIRFDRSANYYIEFMSEEDFRESLTRHARSGTVDVVLTMGTVASALVKSYELQLPHMIIGAIDPVRSGLIDSIDNSGNPLIWAVFDPTGYERQLLYYHDSIPFSNLGIVYYDEVIASLGSYQIAADAMGVRISRSLINRVDMSSEQAEEEYYLSLEAEFRRMAEREGIDAFMLTTDIILDVTRVEHLLEVFTENRIPVFVQVGDLLVQNGALMNVSTFEMEGMGIFIARTITQALSGTPVSELPMEFKNSPYLSLNLDVAERIGFWPSFEMLLSSENIFSSRAIGVEN